MLKIKAISKMTGEELDSPYAINIQKKFILYGPSLRIGFDSVDIYVSTGGEYIKI